MPFREVSVDTAQHELTARILVGLAYGDTECVVQICHLGRFKRRLQRNHRFPVRLKRVKVPLHRDEEVFTGLGSLDSGIINVLFKVKRNLGFENRKFRIWARAAK
jgi:hypothetical protein